MAAIATFLRSIPASIQVADGITLPGPVSISMDRIFVTRDRPNQTIQLTPSRCAFTFQHD